MKSSFHLSIPVRSVAESTDFFVRILGASVQHRDPTGYVNVDLRGTQMTLRESPNVRSETAEIHFGINVGWEDFDTLAAEIARRAPEVVLSKPRIVDAGTPLERKKMSLRCPTGYMIEIKGTREV